MSDNKQPSLKQEAVETYNQAVRNENTRIEQEVEKLATEARKVVLEAAGKRERKVFLNTYPIDHFAACVTTSQQSPIVLTVESGKTDLMKRILQRFIEIEELEVQATRNDPERGVPTFRLELIF